MGKVFIKILNNRLVLWSENNDKLDDSQEAYRKGRSMACSANIWVNVVETYRLLQDGVHGFIIAVIRALYSRLRSCVRVPELFTCTIGTRQGCMISPLLFALYVNELVHMFREFHCPGIYIDNDFPTFNMLMYADDIAIINDTIGRLQSSIDILSTFCDRLG